MIILSHPTGNTFVRQAAIAFQSANLLRQFFTCINWRSQSLLNQLLTENLKSQLERRSFSDIRKELIKAHPLREAGRLAFIALHWDRLVSEENSYFSIYSVYQSLDRYVASYLAKSDNIQGVYAYEDGAYHSFLKAEKLGIKKIYDLPIGYWESARKIYIEEAELKPEWASTLPGLKDSSQKLEKKCAEVELADSIIVASKFTFQTLKNSRYRDKEIHIIPYGMPKPVLFKKINRVKKLKVLYVGSLSQRKGISYLFDAVSSLKGLVDLTVIGRRVEQDCFILQRQIECHKWIESMSHEAILAQMKCHDVFVFPSLFEGFGLVITEALSQGLPVITTNHTIGPDIIKQEENGFIVPIRDSISIANCLETLAKDRDLLEKMSYNAIQSVAEKTWSDYRKKLTKAVL